MLDLVKAKKKTVGLKQSCKALEKGIARRVYIARDAEEKVRQPILEMCRLQGIPVEEVDTMMELGKAGGIRVGTSVIAVIENGGSPDEE